MSETDRFRKEAIATELEESVIEARNLAERFGLRPYPVNYWIVDYDEMNELIAYGGFQSRYPHWRWGMAYDRQRKQDRYGAGKAFEIVNNDNPSHAFLQESNETADQKAVITHVEAHADFFANNEWFGLFTGGRVDEGVDATAMLARNAGVIEGYMRDPDIDRSDVERWVDHCLSLEDAIDQHAIFTRRLELDGVDASIEPGEEETSTLADTLDELGLSEEVKGEVFDDAFLEAMDDTDGESVSVPEEPERDLLGFFREYGMAYDADEDRAVEMEPWQRDVLDMLRAESYYFAPQKMTKVMNEGWASYWESQMMGDERFAGDDEFVTYADHMSKVLGSGGLNPYSLGLSLWEYVENVTNRREVLERLLRVEGVTWRNFEDTVDGDAVMDRLEPPADLASVSVEGLERVVGSAPLRPNGDVAASAGRYVDEQALERAKSGEIDADRYPWKLLTYEGLARRHYSLARRQNRGFLGRASQSDLERISRYLFDDARYETVDDALDDVEFTAGWDRLFDVRESHNDVTFLDEFLTAEFVATNDFFAYEYSTATGQYHVSSSNPEDVKKKLLLQFTNFGKPTIAVYDANYDNANELLLGHEYNGVMLDIERAKDTLKRVFELWGRPVNLLTITTEYDEHEVEVARRRNREPEPKEQGKRIRYDGERVVEEEVPWETVEHLAADDIDYDTKPDEWLS